MNDSTPTTASQDAPTVPTQEQISAIESAPRVLPGAYARRVWCNYILEALREYGAAAHRNRGRNTGTKVHALRCEYVVGLVDESLADNPKTYGAAWKRTRVPQLFSVYPCCGCTTGQHAGRPIPGLTAANITCSRCA